MDILLQTCFQVVVSQNNCILVKPVSIFTLYNSILNAPHTFSIEVVKCDSHWDATLNGVGSNKLFDLSPGSLKVWSPDNSDSRNLDISFYFEQKVPS